MQTSNDGTIFPFLSPSILACKLSHHLRGLWRAQEHQLQSGRVDVRSVRRIRPNPFTPKGPHPESLPSQDWRKASHDDALLFLVARHGVKHFLQPCCDHWEGWPLVRLWVPALFNQMLYLLWHHLPESANARNISNLDQYQSYFCRDRSAMMEKAGLFLGCGSQHSSTKCITSSSTTLPHLQCTSQFEQFQMSLFHAHADLIRYEYPLAQRHPVCHSLSMCRLVLDHSCMISLAAKQGTWTSCYAAFIRP